MAIDRRVARQSARLRSVYAVRGFLVLALFVFQSVEVSESYGRIANTPLWVVPGWSAAALFALAGFTAMRSVERRGARETALRSAVRFLPALVVVAIVTAYVLGGAVTSEPRRSYFVDGEVARYLLNTVGLVQFSLPGVFEFNAAAGAVNAILWIVPVGYLAGLTLAVAAWRPRWTTYLLAGIGLVLAIVSVGLDLAGADLGSPDAVLNVLLGGEGLCALLAFLLGALSYRVRNQVLLDWRVATAVGIVLLVLAAISNPSWSNAPEFNAGVAIPIAYIALYACSWPWPLRRSAPRAAPVLWRILLLAYPVQQLWIALGPDRQNGLVNLLLSLPVVTALATGEWLLIERPLLRRFVPGALPFVPEAGSRLRLDARGYVEQARATAPLLLGALLVIVLMLAALALTMFAMQRDGGGG